MKVSEKAIVDEMKSILTKMNSAYLSTSTPMTCDRILSKAIGKMEALIAILSEAEEE